MANRRQDKIRLLARMNRRRGALQEFCPKLSEILGRRVAPESLAPVEKSDELMAAFRLSYQAAKETRQRGLQLFFPSGEQSAVLDLIARLADRMKDERGFLLTKMALDTEAFSVEVRDVLARAKAVLDLDGDSISLISQDRTQGLLIDQNPDDPTRAYELSLWGDRWLSLMSAA